MRTIIIAIFLLFSSFFYSHACTCGLYPSINTSFNEASIIFIGKVKEVVEDKIFVHQGAPGRIVNFEVMEGFKNVKPNDRLISIIETYGTCSIMFEENDVFVVFAYANGGGIYITSQCTRTAPLQYFNKVDFQELKKLSEDFVMDLFKYKRIIHLNVTEYNSLTTKVDSLEKQLSKSTYLNIILAIALLIGFCGYLYFGN